MDENKKDDNIFLRDDEPVTYENPEIIPENGGETVSDDDERFAGAEKDYIAMYYENSSEHHNYAQQLIQEARERHLKKTLAFSLIGIILSLFFGIGIVFSIIALIRANFGLKKGKSTTLVWARNIAVLGIVLSAVFIVSMLVFVSYTFYSGLLREDVVYEIVSLI